jgi:hypothetical protein
LGAKLNTKLDPDHKQLLDKGVRSDLDWEIFERMSDGEFFYQAWEAGVDWAKYEEKVAELRNQKANAA